MTQQTPTLLCPAAGYLESFVMDQKLTTDEGHVYSNPNSLHPLTPLRTVRRYDSDRSRYVNRVVCRTRN